MRARLLALAGLATVVASVFVGFGERWGSLAMAVAGGALVVVGVAAAWTGGG